MWLVEDVLGVAIAVVVITPMIVLVGVLIYETFFDRSL